MPVPRLSLAHDLAFEQGLSDEIHGIYLPHQDLRPDLLPFWQAGQMTASFYNLARLECPHLQDQPL